MLLRALGHVREPMIALLAAAAAISLVIGERIDALVIFAIVVANTLLELVEEQRAHGASEALRELMAPWATVIRDGEARKLDVREIVPGDLVLLDAGDRVPADGHALEAAALEVDESLLTGESLPVAKVASGDGEATLMMGTTVTRGTARALVTGTGAATELGRIATLEQQPPPPTPLQLRMRGLTGTLMRAAGGICVALATLALLWGESLADASLIGVSLAVAAIPEGLPAVLTLALAIGVRRMAERGAIVRQLGAVETLGATTVVCADKTGTLTENRMAVTRLHACASGDEAEGRLLSAAAFACESTADATPGTVALADPTDAAVIAAAHEHPLGRGSLTSSELVVELEPFENEAKRVSIVVESAGSRTRFVKGAPETVAPLLEDGSAADALLEVAHRWADDGVRVLLVATRSEPDQGEPGRYGDLRPVGLVGLSDPPRPRARADVEEARLAGVRTVMITGDHPRTAAAVARAVGILRDGDEEVLTGSELDRLGDEALRDRAGEISVYARVVPAHKLRIVRALRARGEVVAMTGDGVNDVPALQGAHVGVAMGQRGSDAARQVADIVLADDDYSTIVRAIERGRTTYQNIVRFVHFLLAANAGEVLIFALAISLGLSAPLTVIQILVVNLLTDGPPAIALGADPPEPGLMDRPPRQASESILEPIRGRLVVGGLAVGLAGFAAFLIGDADSQEVGQTMAFATLVFAQLVHVFAVRGDGWAWRAGRNVALLVSVALAALVELAILAVPAVSETFDVSGLGAGQVGAIAALALVPFTSVEIYKARMRRRAVRSRER